MLLFQNYKKITGFILFCKTLLTILYLRAIEFRIMLLIYTPAITNRINYIFRLLFNRILGVEYNITTQYNDWLDYTGPKFCYCQEYDGDELFFQQTPLLTSNGTKKIHIDPVMFEGIKAFFPVSSTKSAFPFDLFSASFYLVSRYEEYIPFIRDIHSRFPASESLALRYGFLQKPVVNIWAKRIGEVLQQRFPDLKFRKRHFTAIQTIDIDSAYSIRSKGFVRVLGGLMKSLYNEGGKDFKKRIRVLMYKEKDPFDSFEYQLEIQQKYNFRPIYFVLMADYGAYDKNIPFQNKTFRDIVKLLADYADVGIHPSYASNDEPEMLKIEVQRLSELLNREIQRSRQHFLRLDFRQLTTTCSASIFTTITRWVSPLSPVSEPASAIHFRFMIWIWKPKHPLSSILS